MGGQVAVSCGGVALVGGWWYLVLGVVGHVGLSGGSWVAVVVRGRGRRN